MAVDESTSAEAKQNQAQSDRVIGLSEKMSEHILG